MSASPSESAARGLPWRRRAGLLILAAAALQALLLVQGFRDNPFVRFPLKDARATWEEAGRLAAGEGGGTPFLGPPLHLLFTAGVRALGGGLEALAAAQALLHLGTLALLLATARRRFGPGPALLAGLFYALTLDPGFAPSRVLSMSLAAFTTVLLWNRWTAPASGLRAHAGTGAALGAAALAWPPWLLLVPVALLRAGRGAGGRAALAAAAALAAVLAPVTLHNLRATGEPILVSAQAGITLMHGNGPGAKGVYTPVAGVSPDRRFQNQDALRVAREQGGAEGWSAASRWWAGQALRTRLEDPAGTLRLEAAKLWWFLSARHYGDIYRPTDERGEAFGWSLRLLPLPVPWLLLPALAFLLLGRRRTGAEALLLAVPLITVLVFFYSPRYRLPAVPLAAVLAAAAAVRLASRHSRPGERVLLGGAFLLALASGPLNAWAGHPDADRSGVRPAFLADLAEAWRGLGNLEAAEAAVDEALALAPGDPRLLLPKADLASRAGRHDEALAAAEEAARRAPGLLEAVRGLAVVRARRALEAFEAWSQGEAAARDTFLEEARAAEEAWRRALRLRPGDPETLEGLRNLERLLSAAGG